MHTLKQFIFRIDESIILIENFIPFSTIFLIGIWLFLFMNFYSAMIDNSLFIVAICLSVGALGIPMYFLNDIPKDPSSYSVGSCYGQRSKNDMNSIKQRIKHLEKSVDTYINLAKIKQLNSESSQNEYKLIADFKSEIKILKEKLNSNHFVSKEQIGYIISEVNDNSNIAYSFADGKYVADYIKKNGDLRVECQGINVHNAASVQKLGKIDLNESFDNIIKHRF